MQSGSCEVANFAVTVTDRERQYDNDEDDDRDDAVHPGDPVLVETGRFAAFGALLPAS
jgi:hypothetical protein